MTVPTGYDAIWSPASSKCARAYLTASGTTTFLMYQCRTAYASTAYALCEYSECSSVSGTTCRFPFKYKGRLYDTCVGFDNKGSIEGSPWCSTSTDEYQNHISGNEQTCSASCERKTFCPVGFIHMYPENTCYQDSASSTTDLVQTFEEAEAKCSEQGARLLRIRSTEALKHLKKMRGEYFMDYDFFPSTPKSFVALGMKYLALDGETSKRIYYRYI